MIIKSIDSGIKRILKSLRCVFICVCMLFCITGLTACREEGNVEETYVEAVVTENTTENTQELESSTNPYFSLNVPTQITKIGRFYFIVDCYNNQVIYNDNLEAPIEAWFVMTDDIKMGHTVASDGTVYLVDDTENNRVLVFERGEHIFVNTQVFDNIGDRPHYIVYNEADKCFYAWSSMTGEMYVFERNAETSQMYLSRIMSIDELKGIYIRSFTIEGDKVYLVSGQSQIIEADISDFKITARYPVPNELAGMIQIMPVNNGYYLTISTDLNGNQDFATIIYTDSLSSLEEGKYTDIYSNFVGGGTPYYMGEIDGRYYLTEHRVLGHSIWSFDIDENGMPIDVVALY